MVIRKSLILFFFSVFLGACVNTEQTNRIEELQKKNDSLNNIIGELNQKYIFDSITIRDIPSYKNTYKKGSNIAGEIVIVGFNLNKETQVILADSIGYQPKTVLYAPDSLKLKNGGFIYERPLEDSLKLEGLIRLGNKYGKSYQGLYSTIIKSKK